MGQRPQNFFCTKQVGRPVGLSWVHCEDFCPPQWVCPGPTRIAMFSLPLTTYFAENRYLLSPPHTLHPDLETKIVSGPDYGSIKKEVSIVSREITKWRSLLLYLLIPDLQITNFKVLKWCKDEKEPENLFSCRPPPDSWAEIFWAAHYPQCKWAAQLGVTHSWGFQWLLTLISHSITSYAYATQVSRTQKGIFISDYSAFKFL